MTDATATAQPPDTLASLWEETWEWLSDLLAVWPGPDQLRAGVTRRIALRMKNWLWSVEGMVRRIMIAAALQLVSGLPAPKSRKAKPKPARAKPKPAAPAFRIFSIRVPGSPEAKAGLTPPQAEAPRNDASPEPRSPKRGALHAAFAADPLLVIGHSDMRRPRGSPARVYLHGRSRSRWDPFYVQDDEEARRSLERYYFGPFRTYPDCTMPDPPRRARSARLRSVGGHRYVSYSRDEILAIEAEEQAVHPAPGLARRMAALQRLSEDIKGPIRRLAQRLRARPELSGILGGAVWMLPKKAKSDRTPAPPGQTTAARICAFLGDLLRPSRYELTQFPATRSQRCARRSERARMS
jgi:hypothetical protein